VKSCSVTAMRSVAEAGDDTPDCYPQLYVVYSRQLIISPIARHTPYGSLLRM